MIVVCLQQLHNNRQIAKQYVHNIPLYVSSMINTRRLVLTTRTNKRNESNCSIKKKEKREKQLQQQQRFHKNNRKFNNISFPHLCGIWMFILNRCRYEYMHTVSQKLIYTYSLSILTNKIIIL